MTPSVRCWSRIGLRSTERALAIVGLCALIYVPFFEVTVVVSGSMAPALQGGDPATGDRVLFEKFTGRFHSPRRWEIHQFYTPEGLKAAKRIVGLPGERIALRAGVLYINGKPIPIPAHLAYLRYLPYGNLESGKEVHCKTGYYVLGDDSRDSEDSRFEGTLAPARFQGRAWLILGPSEHRGRVW